MSFTELLPPEIFESQRQFIRIMDANRDFAWWAESLIVEETAELLKAHEENEGMEQIFKEIGDVIYVVAGFYNTMPHFPQDLLSPERNEKINEIIIEAWTVLANVSNHYMIPLNLMGEAFAAVHVSNLSKLDPQTGEPIRRESDGKILKGPTYQPANMAPVVMKWDKLIEQNKEQET